MYYLCREFGKALVKHAKATQALRNQSAERVRMLDGATIEDPFSILSASIQHPLRVTGESEASGE